MSAMPFPIRVFAVVPAHNRRDTTLNMLSSLMSSELPRHASLTVCLIDDGSTDGTAEAVAAQFPAVRVYSGTGSLYWSGAARLGIDLFRESDCNHLLLLNDDLTLRPDCLRVLLQVAMGTDSWIMSATVIDENKSIIYGGLIGLPMFRFRKVKDEDYCEGKCMVDTVNGNCLLISRDALETLELPPHGIYTQEAFDMYLGLAASRLGRHSIVLRNAICQARPNKEKFWFYRRDVSFRERVRGILGPKGVPPSMYWDFCKRFAGSIAPLVFLRPYVRVFFPRGGKKT